MSVFTNPASGAQEAADAYIHALLELLGDRDPFEVLESLMATAEELVADVDDSTLRRPEAPGKWSMIEVLQHLADSELVWAYRLRMVLAEKAPVLTGYDQDRWASRLAYREADLQDTLSQLRTLRGINLRLLHSLTPQDLQRTGRHGERGEESVEHMIRLYAGHDLIHLAQLRRISNPTSTPAGHL